MSSPEETVEEAEVFEAEAEAEAEVEGEEMSRAQAMQQSYLQAGQWYTAFVPVAVLH